MVGHKTSDLKNYRLIDKNVMFITQQVGFYLTSQLTATL